MNTLLIPADALVILCGPAASGKSRFAHLYFRPTQIVSSDRCRAMVADDESNQAVSDRAFDIFLRLIGHRLALGRLTVADSTALSAKARADLRRLARRFGRPAILVAFDVGLQSCFSFNRMRTRRVPAAIIRKHRQRFLQESSKFQTEGYWTIYRLTARTARTARVEIAAPVRSPAS